MQIARHVLILAMHVLLMRNDPLVQRAYAQQMTYVLLIFYTMQHALVILVVFLV